MNIKGLLFIIGILSFQPVTGQTSSLKIGWDGSNDTDILGYRVYWGTVSHQYRFYLDVGKATRFEIMGLIEGMRYHVAVTAIDYWGNESPFSDEIIAIPGFGAVAAEIPKILSLGHNFPNPFNPATIISFDVPERQHIAIVIYNSLGQKIKTLESRVFDADFHETRWDGTDENNRLVSAGLYFYQLESATTTVTRSMTFLR